MQEQGATRPFEGRLEIWSYAPINDTELVASAIRRAFGLEIKSQIASLGARLADQSPCAYLFTPSEAPIPWPPPATPN